MCSPGFFVCATVVLIALPPAKGFVFSPVPEAGNEALCKPQVKTCICAQVFITFIFPHTASPAVLKYTERCCVDCSETLVAVLAAKLGLGGRSPLLEVICPTGQTLPLKMLLEFITGLTRVVLAVVTQPMLPVAIKLHVYCMNSQ